MHYTSETKLQSDCFIWAWNNLPETRRLLCYNLNNSANHIQGSRNKAMGVIKGRSDMVMYWEGKAHMIEFKIPGETQSKDQAKWESKITAHGFAYHIIDSFEDFQDLIRGIVK